jgi:hypothetical protein
MAGMESYLPGAGSRPRAGALRMFKLNVSNKCDEFTVDGNLTCDCESFTSRSRVYSPTENTVVLEYVQGDQGAKTVLRCSHVRSRVLQATYLAVDAREVSRAEFRRFVCPLS